jgi:hypothetical protein
VRADLATLLHRGLPFRFPESIFRAVPLFAAQGPLQICVATLSEGGMGMSAARSPLVSLRTELDARVYLGCITDISGKVLDWLEIWIQDLSRLNWQIPRYLENLNNPLLDRRWELMVEAMERCSGAPVIRTGFETHNPAPTYLDRNTFTLRPAADAKGRAWTLCRDDELLHRTGRMKYSSSIERHLVLGTPAAEGDPAFWPVCLEHSDEHVVEQIRREAPHLSLGSDQIPLNPGAGRLMVRKLVPHGYETMVDLLSKLPGRSRQTLETSDDATQVASYLADFDRIGSRRWLLSADTSRFGQILEVLYLKLRLLTGAIAAVRDFVTVAQSPMFNLGLSSFSVMTGGHDPDLPPLWTSRTILTRPGKGVRLPIRATSQPFFAPIDELGAGDMDMDAAAYSPDVSGAGSRARGRLSVLKRSELRAADGGGVEHSFELALYPDNPPLVRINDLVRIDCTVRRQPVELFGSVISPADLTQSRPSIAVRTFAQRLHEQALQVMVGVGEEIGNVSFETIAFRKTPFDLHSLGVLALRTLLCGTSSNLPAVRRDFFDLVNTLGRPDPAKPLIDSLVQSIAGQFGSGKQNWATKLGPQQCFDPAVASEGSLASVIPADLWYRVLAAIARMFPDRGPYSAYADLGSIGDQSLHTVFDESLELFGDVMRRIRAILLAEHSLNAEVRGILSAAKARI